MLLFSGSSMRNATWQMLHGAITLIGGRGGSNERGQDACANEEKRERCVECCE